MSLDRFLGKKYKHEHSENFDEFMKKCGIGYFIRKFGNSLHPVMELSKDGDKYVISSMAMTRWQIKFQPDNDVYHVTPYGKKAVYRFTIDGNILKQCEKHYDGKQVLVTRIFDDKETKVIMEIGDIKCTQIFKCHD